MKSGSAGRGRLLYCLDQLFEVSRTVVGLDGNADSRLAAMFSYRYNDAIFLPKALIQFDIAWEENQTHLRPH